MTNYSSKLSPSYFMWHDGRGFSLSKQAEKAMKLTAADCWRRASPSWAVVECMDTRLLTATSWCNICELLYVHRKPWQLPLQISILLPHQSWLLLLMVASGDGWQSLRALWGISLVMVSCTASVCLFQSSKNISNAAVEKCQRFFPFKWVSLLDQVCRWTF